MVFNFCFGPIKNAFVALNYGFFSATIQSKSIFALSPLNCMLSKEAANTNQFHNLWFDPTSSQRRAC
jgi:hypothetical protein